MAKLPMITGLSKLNHIYYNLSSAFLGVAGIFKVLNLVGADAILSLAGILFALAYVIKGIDTRHEEYDWALAYPELAGMSESSDSHKS